MLMNTMREPPDSNGKSMMLFRISRSKCDTIVSTRLVNDKVGAECAHSLSLSHTLKVLLVPLFTSNFSASQDVRDCSQCIEQLMMH